jgi:ABC-type multidrug transport system permease subunit
MLLEINRFIRNPNGSINRRKERIIAKGFDQLIGIDYHNTFSLVVRLATMLYALLSFSDGILDSWIFLMLFFMVF